MINSSTIFKNYNSINRLVIEFNRDLIFNQAPLSLLIHLICIYLFYTHLSSYYHSFIYSAFVLSQTFILMAFMTFNPFYQLNSSSKSFREGKKSTQSSFNIWLAYQAISSRRPWPLRRPPFLLDCTKWILVFLPTPSIFSPPWSFYDVWLASEDSFARRASSLSLDAWSLLNDPPFVLFILPSFCSCF